jgi:Family of unknown function (DUF6508)
MVCCGCHEKRSIAYIARDRNTYGVFAEAILGGFFARGKLGPYPNYNPVVEEFFRLVSSEGWLDREYNPEQAYQMLKDENGIKIASLSQIKTMLTFCVRGERFSDGHWAQMIEEGYIRRLLERLNEIKSEQIK